MAEQIQIHRKKSARLTDEAAASTFPETQVCRAGGGDDDGIEELLARIEQVLESTRRSLGKASGIEAV